MEAIKPGDVVTLKSGSRSLTVESVEGTSAWVVAERGTEIVRHQITLVALTIVRPGGHYGDALR